MSKGQLTEKLIARVQTKYISENALCIYMASENYSAVVSLRLLCAWHDVWLILAVVELSCSTQFLIFLSLSELLQLGQFAGKLVAI